LIARARAGDRAALDQLFARYRAYLRLTIAGSMGPTLRRDCDASDVLQETLLVAAERFTKFYGTEEGELIGWLRVLASRKLIDLARRAGRIKRAPKDQLSLNGAQPGSDDKLVDQLAGDLTSPSQAAAKREMAVKLADALAQIDPTEAEVIWLHHADGMSFEEIGRRIGTGRNGARGVWVRGLRNLRQILPSGGLSGTL
jgi:RNA polymerase sigma-70 factor (ECF subfamily)